MTKVRRNLKFIIAGLVMAAAIMILTGIRAMAADTNPSKCYQSGLYGSIPWHMDPYKDGGCSLTISYGQGDSSQPSWAPYNKDIVHVEFTDPKHTVFGPEAVWAFSGMNLVDSDSFNIKDVDMSKVRNMISMFADTTMDAPLDLDGDGWHNTSEVVTTANMFERFHAPGLKGIGRMDTSNVTSMSNMFHEANLGDSVLDVSGMNTAKVQDMSNLFCNALAADIKGFENWDMSSVTSLNQVISAGFKFNRTIDLSGWNLSSIIKFYDTFNDLKSDGLNLSSWKLPNLIDSTFFLAASDIGHVDLTGWEIGAPCEEEYCQPISIIEMFSNANVTNVTGLNTWKMNRTTDLNLELPVFSEKLDLSGLDVRNIGSVSDFIGYCSNNVQSLDISNIDFTGKDPTFINKFLGEFLFCRNLTKVNMASTVLDGTSSEHTFRLPPLMNELTIGKDVHLNDQSMEDVGSNKNDSYTGRWIEVNSGPDDKDHLWESQSTDYAESAKELAARSREGNAGTYVKQRKVVMTYDRNAEDATGIPDHDQAGWPDLGEGVVLPKDANRDGYVLKSWNTAKDGSGQSYKPGERIHPQNSMTLYAQWSVKTSTIRFNDNGSGSTVKPDDIEANGRPTVTIPCDVAPIKPGSTFIGWSRTKSPVLEGADAGKKGKVEACGYSKNTSIAAPEDGFVDLYAVWARNPKAVFNENRPKDMTALLPETNTITGDWYMSGLTPRTYVGPDLFGWYRGYSPDGVYQFDGWTNEDGSPFTGAYLERDDVAINAKWSRMASDNSHDETGVPSGNAGHEEDSGNSSGSSDTGNDSSPSSEDETNDNQEPANGEPASNTADGIVAGPIGSNQNKVSDSTVDSDTVSGGLQQDDSPSTDTAGTSSNTNTSDEGNDSDGPINDSKSSDGSSLARTGVSVAIPIVSIALLVLTVSMVMVIRRHLN